MLLHVPHIRWGLLIAPFGRSRFGANGKPIGLLRPVPDDICISKKGLVSTPAKSGHPTNLRAGKPLTAADLNKRVVDRSGSCVFTLG